MSYFDESADPPREDRPRRESCRLACLVSALALSAAIYFMVYLLAAYLL